MFLACDYREMCGKKSSWKQTEIVQGTRNNNALPRKWKTPQWLTPHQKRDVFNVFPWTCGPKLITVFDGRLLTVTNPWEIISWTASAMKKISQSLRLLLCCYTSYSYSESKMNLESASEDKHMATNSSENLVWVAHLTSDTNGLFAISEDSTWSYPCHLGATPVFKLGHLTCFQLSSLDLRGPKRAGSSWRFNISREDREWRQSWEHLLNKNQTRHF